MAEDLPAELRDFLDGWAPEAEVVPLSGDASVRRYFRVRRSGGSAIVAWYPEELRAQLRRFLAAAAALRDSCSIPEIFASSDACVAQQDVGDATVFDRLHADAAEGAELYGRAVRLLLDFQRAAAGEINPPFTAEFFRSELEMTREFYVERLLGVAPADAAALSPWFDRIAETIARHPYRLCHRDYHGQNIHIFNDCLYLIDYQDMRFGPDTYDLASLLRDRGVASLLGGAEEALLGRYAEALGGDPREVRRRYFESLLQRSVKILGTFAKMPIVRGRMHYLEFIPSAVESVRRCLDELPEMAPLASMLPLEVDMGVLRAAAAREHALQA